MSIPLWKELSNKMTIEEIDTQKPRAKKWLLIAASGAFLMSSFFLIKFMVGGAFSPSVWTGEQWVNVLGALIITSSITAAQYSLYTAGQKNLAAIIGVCIVVFFGLFSEVSNSMERESSTVRERSQESGVFKATLSAINNARNESATISPALLKANEELAKARIEIADCGRHAPKGQARVDRCLKYERTREAAALAKIAAIKEASREAMQANSKQAVALADKAKELSFDEEQHFEAIKLFRDFLNIKAIFASFIVSLIFMGTFEYCFHYLAVYYSALCRASKYQHQKDAKHSDTTTRPINTDTYTQPKGVPQSAYNAPVNALNQSSVSAVSASKQPSVSVGTASLIQGSTSEVIDTVGPIQPQPTTLKKMDGIGFNATVISDEDRPSAVPVQSKQHDATDTENVVYAEFIRLCKAGEFKSKSSDFNARDTKKWIAERLDVSQRIGQQKAHEWLEVAGQAGELKRNPKWTEGSRANKWSIK